MYTQHGNTHCYSFKNTAADSSFRLQLIMKKCSPQTNCLTFCTNKLLEVVQLKYFIS